MPRSERVQRALGVPGWMTEAELGWLEEQAQTHFMIAEIGSWQGRSTIALAATSGVVYSIDDHRGEKDTPVEDLGALFAEHLEPELASGKVEVMNVESREAAKEFLPPALDMVFIDGSHDYPDPLEDIEAWRPTLREGGLLCGHDSTIAGVMHSLAELGIEKEPAACGSIWVAK